MRHVVWDWNGTLLDDLDLVVRSVNASLESLGVDPIDHGGYRRQYTRPVRLFYEAILSRAVTDDEMAEIDRTFHEAYFAAYEMADLAADAGAAMDAVAAAGATQSIASMLRHDHLVTVVRDAGLHRRMLAVDGHRGIAGETKAAHLAHHVDQLRALHDLGDRSMVLIGDISDDADAAGAVGIDCVLVDAGSQERSVLERTGVPVVGSLTEAVVAAGL